MSDLNVVVKKQILLFRWIREESRFYRKGAGENQHKRTTCTKVAVKRRLRLAKDFAADL